MLPVRGPRQDIRVGGDSTGCSQFAVGRGGLDRSVATETGHATDAATRIGSMHNNASLSPDSPSANPLAMRILRKCLCLAIAFCLLSSVAAGFGINRWDMPSRCAQCFGYGYGPGYHAPMIRSPCRAPARQQRFVVAPVSGPSCTPCSGYNCSPTMPCDMGPQNMGPGDVGTPDMAPPEENLPPVAAEPNQALFFAPNAGRR